MPLNIKPKVGCRWDLVSLGEVMLRFDPGEYGFGPLEISGSAKEAENTMSRVD